MKITIAAALLLSLVLGQTVYAQAPSDYGIYEIHLGRTNKPPDHVTADFILFISAINPTKKDGLLFLQKKGPFMNGAFVCMDATHDAAKKSYSCTQPVYKPNGKLDYDETLTVGVIDDNNSGDPDDNKPDTFCADLRWEHRNKDPNDKTPNIVMTKDECDMEFDKCACYQIQHISRVPEGPPSPGAGSGGSH